MTPRETFMVIEAALWRDEAKQRAGVTQAWLTAALSRAKRLPKLDRLITKRAKQPDAKELARRKQDFQEMTQNIDLKVLK